MFGRVKSLVGVDIGSASVKIVELTRSGTGLVITGMGSAPIESPEAVGAAIQKVLADTGIKGRRCATSVSGRSVIIRQVPMEQLPDSELRQAVEYAADKYIPFDVSEVQLDVQRLGDAPDVTAGQTKVLLVAAKKTLVEEHVALLQSVGLKPAIIDVDVFALGNAFELRNLLLGISDQEVRALIDIGASKTNINIMRGNASVFQREIYLAGNDLTEAIAKRFGEDPKDVERMKKDPGGALESMQDAMLPVMEDMGSEIRLSFDYFENQFNQQVKEVYLSGGSVYFPGVDTLFGQVFNLPTKLWDPTEGLEITGFNPQGMSGANSDLAIAMGLAGRILGTMNWSVAGTTSVSSAAPAAETETVTPSSAAQAAVRVPAAAPEDKKCWATGLVIGLLAGTAVALGLGVANHFGYSQWWSMGEGLPLGVAVGLGLWQGLKRLRRAPFPTSVVAASLFTSLVCCGLLFGMRYLRQDSASSAKKVSITMPKLSGGKELTPAEAMLAAPIAPLPENPTPEQKAKYERELKARQSYDGKPKEKNVFDINDISSLMFALGHLILTNFVTMMLVLGKAKKIKG